MQQIVKSADD